MMYDRGAITLETNGVRAKPYRAAPRSVAVSASAGLAITRMRDENCCYTEMKGLEHSSEKGGAWAHLDTLFEVFTPCKTTDKQYGIYALLDLVRLIFNQVQDLMNTTEHTTSAGMMRHVGDSYLLYHRIETEMALAVGSVQ